ncbi:cytidylate kinase family protein [Actinacidiphila sp. bgisy144]|uniref:cytidylate kinase family protein n=1 Tax=unclassified Actinacidiphila TaxID=2995708 RepID=UPI003EBD8E13
MEEGTREELIGRLVGVVGDRQGAHPVRVAVDGAPGAGKTTLADELAGALRAQGREVIRATVDDFLVPRAQRYRRGRYSAEGCYFDAHDRAALRRVLLDPLGPGGDRRFRTAAYDHAADARVSPPPAVAAADAVLLFDGVFLMRPELVDRWELRIFVAVPFEQTVERARRRSAASGDGAAVERSWRDRYIPAQELYFATAHPEESADVVVHNGRLRHPAWEVRPRSSACGM